MNGNQYSNPQPVEGNIYRDQSDSSFMVLNITADKILLAYASGAVTSIDVENWQQLQPQIAVY